MTSSRLSKIIMMVSIKMVITRSRKRRMRLRLQSRRTKPPKKLSNRQKQRHNQTINKMRRLKFTTDKTPQISLQLQRTTSEGSTLQTL